MVLRSFIFLATQETSNAYETTWASVTRMFHQLAEGSEMLGNVAEGERDTEGEVVVQDMQRDGSLQAAGADRQPGSDDPEPEPVEEHRPVELQVRAGKDERGEQDREPTPPRLLDERPDRHQQIATEDVLLPAAWNGVVNKMTSATMA